MYCFRRMLIRNLLRTQFNLSRRILQISEYHFHKDAPNPNADEVFSRLAAKKFQHLVEIPTPVWGHISTHVVHSSATKDCGSEQESLITLETQWSVTNVLRKKRSTLAKTIFLPSDDLAQAHSSPYQPLDDSVVWDVWSPSGRQRALCIEQKGENGKGSQFFVEIWRQHELIRVINVSAQKKHGPIHKSYAEGTVGCFEWSHSESHLMYLAEKYKPESKGTSFYDCESNGSGDSAGKVKDSTRGESFLLEENWGEQLTQVQDPVLCLLHVDEGVVSVLWPLPAETPDEKQALPPWSPMCAVWCPDDTGVLLVACENGPYPLGKVYCTQRPSVLFHLHFETAKCEVVGHEKRAVASPRFSPDGSHAVWLEQDAWGPHYQCKRLIACDWSTKEIWTAVEVVAHAGDGFPGIFTLSLKERCWSQDNKRILVSSQWRSRMELLVVNVHERLGKRVTLPDGGLSVACAKLLDVAAFGDVDLVLAQFSSPSRLPYLVIAALPENGLEDNIKWHTVRVACDFTLPTVPYLSWHINRHIPQLHHPQYGAQTFESILMLPRSSDPLDEDKSLSKQLPVILFPHGGPHSVITATFSAYCATLVACGFAVLAVNYRGSCGFGQDFVRSLLGHIGEIDVVDCMQALQDTLSCSGAPSLTDKEAPESSSFVQVETKLDPDRVAVFGGSHGGFLVGHLMGQHPNVFRAACARNPVINLSTLVGTSDIPDWCLMESFAPEANVERHRGDPYLSLLPTADMVTAMWKASPLRWVEHMHTPLMLVVGGADLRVPSAQAKEIYHALKSRQVPVKMYFYPEDRHPLDRVETEAEVIVNLVRWYAKWMDLTPPTDSE